MALSNETMKVINTAIEAYLKEKKKQIELFNSDPVNFIPMPPTLTQSLNCVEISYAEEELRRTNQQIILVKIPYGAYCKIYYYKYLEENFVVVLDNNNRLVSIS
jgi:hypothetical protein